RSHCRLPGLLLADGQRETDHTRRHHPSDTHPASTQCLHWRIRFKPAMSSERKWLLVHAIVVAYRSHSKSMLLPQGTVDLSRKGECLCTRHNTHAFALVGASLRARHDSPFQS